MIVVTLIDGDVRSIDDKLQGRVAKCGNVTSKSVVVSCTLCAWPPHCQKAKEVHETITFLPNIHRFRIFFLLTDSALTTHHTLNMYLHYVVIYCQSLAF